MSDPKMTDAKQIRLLMLDVDGVLTDGSLLIDGEGRETKRFNVRDGLGIKLWMKMGLDIAIVSGRQSDATSARAAELGITRVEQGAPDKLASLERLCRELGIEKDQVACMGDDLPDLPPMRAAGWAIAVGDGDPRVRACAQYVTEAPGGRGAVREAIEHLLEKMDLLDGAIAHYD
jgi:3-deoxy-D-manno-octulosonate 8-phosphate phosphatase (KDO 8-P phosphatase)